MSSEGSSSCTALTTVSPPTPESKIPSGAEFTAASVPMAGAGASGKVEVSMDGRVLTNNVSSTMEGQECPSSLPYFPLSPGGVRLYPRAKNERLRPENEDGSRTSPGKETILD